jgi:hypothetical protein
MRPAKRPTPKDARAELLALLQLAEQVTDAAERALGTVDEVARRLLIAEQRARKPQTRLLLSELSDTHGGVYDR